LGSLIADELSRMEGVKVRALVRPGKAGQLPAGLEAVEGDLLREADVRRAMEGIDTVVSAVGNSYEQTVTGQLNLVGAAAEAGVRRFIPSDFSLDYRKLQKGDNANLDMRFPVLEALRATKMQPLSVLHGGYMEITFTPGLPLFDLQAGVARYWGDAAQPMDLITMPDAAAYTARVAVDESYGAEDLMVAGTVASPAELASELGLRLERQGSIADLQALIARTKETASNPWEYIRLQYVYGMQSGLGKLERLDNARYPDVRPTGVRDFLSRR
jgi:uncharacterized protein YbjT (DUF2867 family)